MNPSTSTNRRRLLRLMTIVAIILAVLIVVRTVLAINLKQHTGILRITPFASNAGVSISQDTAQATLVGTGTVNIRVKPGSYLIAAGSDGKVGMAQATVNKQGKTDVRVVYTDENAVPAPDNIDFTGTSQFIDRGLSQDQVSNLKNMFFKYKESAKQITITKDSLTITYPVTDDGTQPFIGNFSGTIDGKPYRGQVAYTDLENVVLTIFDPTTGTQLFQRSSVESAGM